MQKYGSLFLFSVYALLQMMASISKNPTQNEGIIVIKLKDLIDRHNKCLLKMVVASIICKKKNGNVNNIIMITMINNCRMVQWDMHVLNVRMSLIG